MKFNLKIWRQEGPTLPGRFADYTVDNIIPEMSFLEMLDALNEDLIKKGEEPVAFDSDCREGICGTCGLVIDGLAHGPKLACTTCEVRMRVFEDGCTITVEPFRAKAFPVIKDLVVDRTAFDRIIAKGGYVSENTGSAPDGNAIPVSKDIAEAAMDSAACIGCGACVAACPNASASLFVSAKISQFALLPQGHAERKSRATNMVGQMDDEGFGHCSNHAECEAACPKGISIENIARMRREYLKAI
ncbi:MAG TPA: succinate dehydrogenase/fumarate reductase iron-sulfur subunit [Kiritimatiellia bacterium]|mgnify:FL=1|nr:succinate dehydrogenase/fumarate reductase iron-sulfur subunit [Kiritimatiellia bacterium]HMO99706.1 succinate dehydrogenase/fumarate reductase iron-sulfur subunit [Kiritimatiellia bacterium]HMP97050.1 succinate dehydrogenase/fumarate reductase iron-sulfur subunit [Kiritimatiellia bacterium]